MNKAILVRIGRRAVGSLVVIWAVFSLSFVINNVLPSDPARMVAGAQARPGDVARIRTQLGLDRPLSVQYASFWARLFHVGSGGSREHASCATWGPVHVDLGQSYQQRRPVVTILGERIPRTLFLAIAALSIQVLIGVMGGMAAAIRKRRWLDHLTVGASLVGISAPTFLTGVALQYVLAYKLRLLPLDGFGQTPAEHAVSVILPALTLGLFGAAFYTRIVRDEMIVLLKQDHVRTARAKGLGRTATLVTHGLRNAMVPLVTVAGLELGALAGGAIVTEALFRWPGLGALSVNALLDRDGPVVLGTVLVTSTAVVVANLAVDIAVSLLDPRTR